jgi:hypothetical protein
MGSEIAPQNGATIISISDKGDLAYFLVTDTNPSNSPAFQWPDDAEADKVALVCHQMS